MSLAIITKDRPSTLEACLWSIIPQATSKDEILIIDSSADNRTKALCHQLQKYSSAPIHHYFEPRPGYDIGRNRAVKEAKGYLLGFTDDDCVLDSHWMHEMKKTMTSHSSVDIVAGESMTYFPHNVCALATQFYEIFWKKNAIKNDSIIDLEILDTKNIVYRRSLFTKYKLIFSNIYSKGRCWTTDDRDMGMQLMEVKAKAFYQPKAIVYHKDPQILKTYIKKILFSAISTEFYLKKWAKKRELIRQTGFTKKSTLSYIYKLYHPLRHEQIMLSLLLGGTDRILQYAPVISYYYE